MLNCRGWQGALVALLLLLGGSLAPGEELPAPAPATQQQHEAWLTALRRHDQAASTALFQQLLTMPDADLVLLADVHYGYSDVARLAGPALGKLQTDRAFAALVARLKGPDMFEREGAVLALAQFHQERCVAPLVEVLAHDPAAQVRRTAANELRLFDTPAARAALRAALHDTYGVASQAAFALGQLQDAAAIPDIYHLISAPGREGDAALRGLCAMHVPAAVPLLIALMDQLPQLDGKMAKFELEMVDGVLLTYARQTTATLGPVPDTSEQWRAWWQAAAPLFDEHLQLKAHLPPTYQPADFAPSLRYVTMTSRVTPARSGSADPLQVEVEVKNAGKQPVMLILPTLPSGWYPTMAWGIVLRQAGWFGKTLLDQPASGYYLGSYGGPPPFELLAPGAVVRKRVCLLAWLWIKLKEPLPPGDYTLELTFDASQFPAVHASGNERLGVLQAQAAPFTIAGQRHDDPDYLFKAIGELTDSKWLRADLSSRRQDRRERAWSILAEYGDSRLQSVIDPLRQTDLCPYYSRQLKLRACPPP